MADIYDASAKHMAQLAADERGAASAMVNAWGEAWQAINADLEKLTAKMAAARAAGEEVGPSWLHQERRLRTLQANAEAHLRQYARNAALETQALRAQAVAASQVHAAELAAMAAGPRRGAAVVDEFTRVPGDVLELLVGNLSPRSPLAQLAATLPGDGAARLTDALVRGVARGLGPREIARDARHALGGNLARALTIARTEQLRVYREASRLAYEQNPGLVVGWRWTAAKDLRTCAACWAMDGSQHALTERLDGHPNCRCAMVPLTEAGQTYGQRTGPDQFAALPASRQRDILGSAKYDAYAAGRVKLPDLVGRSDSAKWGTSRHERSLADAEADRGRGAAFRLGAGL